jgi:hypothetical protein
LTPSPARRGPLSSPDRGGALAFLLRLLFFASAPRLLVFAAALYPVTGAIIQIAVALAVFILGEAARTLASRSRLAATFLRPQLAFEAYYRVHPPRPVLYYLFYPLLFPYWLTNKNARDEFLLFKGYTLASFGVLVASLVVQYFRSFPPELTFQDFLPIAAKTLVAETVVVLVFLMPIVTSVVHYHRERAPRRLAIILAAGILSSGLAIARLEQARDPVVSLATRERVRLRTARDEKKAYDAMARALGDAWRALPKTKNDVDGDGKVEGAPLDLARATLERFYKNDETYAFDLWSEKRGRAETLVIYFEARGNRPPIWLAMDTPNATYSVAKRLPRGALLAMKAAADALGE